jgi:hypothetical protein
MVLHMIAMLMVEVTIVQVIGVTIVLYSLMAAIGTMRMAMGARMLMMWLRHFSSFHNAAFRPLGAKRRIDRAIDSDFRSSTQ